MQRRILSFLTGILFVSMFVVGTASADMKEDALALVKKGNEFVQKNGIEKAAQAFQEKEFKQGDLYLFAYDFKGNCLAQGAKPEFVGKNLWNLKTPTGTYLFHDLTALAKNGGGWIEYQWMNPFKKKLMTKESFIMPVEGKEIFVGCGYFKE